MSSSSTYSNSTALGYNAQVTASNQIQLGNSSVTNVKTSGTLTLGSITYPNTAGTNGYYLKTDGSGNASWASVSGSGIPYTGANQAVDLGSYDLTVNGLKIGKGLNNISGNTVLGINSLSAIGISGGFNTAIGGYTLYSNLNGHTNVALGQYSLFNNLSGMSNVALGNYSLYENISGNSNVAVGIESLGRNTTGGYNTSIGLNSMYYNTIGESNSALGVSALNSNVNGAYNTAIGVSALASNVSGSNNTAIGNLAMYNNTTYSNSTALGYNAQVTASNQIQLGNSSVTDVKTNGVITSAGFKIAGGTSTQTIMADGSVNSTMLSLLNKILYIKFTNGSRPEVWIANYDGTNSSKVNITLPSGIEFEDGLEGIKLSPDGKKIFFNAGPAASFGAPYAGSTDIYSCNSDGSSVTKIIDRTTFDKVMIRSAQ